MHKNSLRKHFIYCIWAIHALHLMVGGAIQCAHHFSKTFQFHEEWFGTFNKHINPVDFNY